MYVDYNLHYPAKRKINPEINLGIMVVNKNAEIAVLAFGDRKRSKNMYEVRLPSGLSVGKYQEFERFPKGQNPKGEYINLLEFLLVKTVSKINAGLQQ
ncbi:MAG: hypothetical protein OEZ22_06230 [Spirochaetia bacterium]|nr:hypothetical protein [Spirochaetia bacterium]